MILELEKALTYMDKALAKAGIALLTSATKPMLDLKADLVADKEALKKTIKNYVAAW